MALAAPTLGVPMLVSHLVSIEAKIPQGRRFYRRFSPIYASIGLISLLLVVPKWTKFTGDATAMRGYLAPYLHFALSNWASAIVTRSLAVMIPPLCAWAIYNSKPILAPVVIIFGLFCVPALIAGVLIVREVRSRHQKNKPKEGDDEN